MKRNKFSLSHYKLLTMELGRLVPLTWTEALPGDTFQQSTSALLRVSPLLSPVMHPVRVRIHHFFVPNRLIWDEWEDFITGGPDGTSVPTHPYKDINNLTNSSLLDYLGLPTGALSGNIPVNALPLRAYNLIYNEFYRDQDLVGEQTIDLTSGADTTTDVDLLKVSWEKDYFTTARPWEQKGDVVTIPLLDDAPVFYDGTTGGNEIGVYDGGGPSTGTPRKLHPTSGTYLESTVVTQADADYRLKADLSAATGIGINDLRLALSLQRYQEARAQYGSRYVEYLKYLGIRPSDARLQNPEYLGGGRQTIQFSEVLSSDGANTGDLKGHGISAMRTNRYRRYFEEHGIVMTLMSVVPKSIYTTAINKSFLRTVKEDYFQRELQYLGEQEVTYKEIQGEHSTPDAVFGYQSRYDEYRYKESGLAGDFNKGATLNYWHLAREFSGDIALNQSFVECTPSNRIYASTTEDPLYVMSNHSIQARRMLAYNPKPRTF